MKTGDYSRLVALLAVGLLLPGVAARAQQTVSSGKIPITTSSDEARGLYLQGRDLAEKLRATDARYYYQQAIEKDGNFALAHLGLANTAPTNKEFFESVKRAVAVASSASEGERRLIMALDAGVKGDPSAQKEQLSALVDAFPDDERAHNALGGFHFGRQEYGYAIAQYTKATGINPDFSPPYNNLGYAHRFLGDYGAAEQAFQKYIQLISDEPNPYDSYAELLMKMGRFEESIENYERALSVDRNFVFSYVGIGNNQIFMGYPAKARETFKKLGDRARNDGERRQALFWTGASYVYEGKPDAALEKVKAMYSVAEAKGDMSQMSGDYILMGNILLNTGDADKAEAKFRRAVELIDKADVPDQVKEATRRNQLYRDARVALAKYDLGTAKSKTKEYGRAVKERSIPFELRNHHELVGLIALQEKGYEKAVSSFERANQQNPRVIFLTALAYRGKGDSGKARELAEKAANFNGLNLNYAYVKTEAERMLQKN